MRGQRQPGGQPAAPGHKLRTLVEQHHHNEHDSIHQHAVIAEAAQQLRQDGEQRSRNDGTTDVAHTAHNDKHQNQNGSVVIKLFRHQRGEIMRIQRARQTGQRCGNSKRDELIPRDIDAHGFRCDAVVPDGHNRTARAGIDEVQNDEERDENKYKAQPEGGASRHAR